MRVHTNAFYRHFPTPVNLLSFLPTKVLTPINLNLKTYLKHKENSYKHSTKSSSDSDESMIEIIDSERFRTTIQPNYQTIFGYSPKGTVESIYSKESRVLTHGEVRLVLNNEGLSIQSLYEIPITITSLPKGTVRIVSYNGKLVSYDNKIVGYE